MIGPGRSARRIVTGLVLLGAACVGVEAVAAEPGPAAPASAPAAPSEEAAAVLHQLRTFASTGRVLHVAAHPDDENTQLIAYLSRGRGYDTAYLSITRGDGGQNLLGPEFDEKLGVARTQELLAARRLDGGRQFFTRAIDFGFSKNPEETLAIWNHREVLSDVVRIVRRFRPDVIVTRFPIPPGSGGHGHHTASAMLAVEAFRLAADPNAYPEQLEQGLKPWQAKRVVWNGSGFSRGGGIENNPTIKLDISGTDPATGEALGVIAARSRAMHKTQGFGEFGSRGSSGARVESFVHLGGEAATRDLMDGVDTSWDRVRGGDAVGRKVAELVAGFDPKNMAAMVPALLELQRQLGHLEGDAIVDDKRPQLDEILRRCLALRVSSVTAATAVIPLEQYTLSATVECGASIPVRWISVEQGAARREINQLLAAGTPLSREVKARVPADAPVTQPYWLRLPGTTGLSHVSDPHLIGMPENPPDLPVTYVFEVRGQKLVVHDRVLSRAGSADGVGAAATPIVPPVSVSFDSAVTVFRPGTKNLVRLTVRTNRSELMGAATLELPEGWTGRRAFHFRAKPGVPERLEFHVTAPTDTAVASVGVNVAVRNAVCRTDSFTLSYPHLPPQLLQPLARKKLLAVDVVTRGAAIGYVAGAGDDVAQALTELGYQVTMVPPADFTMERLRRFDAIVVGVRAFNTRSDLSTVLPALFAYAEQGGTVVCQYNWARNLKTDRIAPHRIALSGSRVTDENAAVTFLAPEHPVLTTPNKIGPEDFAGWVQERGVYFPNEWDDAFVPILSMGDPGEPQLKGALLVAPHGKGWFVYTSLAFFRQLPAGVPGAYRLFANLVSLGK